MSLSTSFSHSLILSPLLSRTPCWRFVNCLRLFLSLSLSLSLLFSVTLTLSHSLSLSLSLSSLSLSRTLYLLSLCMCLMVFVLFVFVFTRCIWGLCRCCVWTRYWSSQRGMFWFVFGTCCEITHSSFCFLLFVQPRLNNVKPRLQLTLRVFNCLAPPLSPKSPMSWTSFSHVSHHELLTQNISLLSVFRRIIAGRQCRRVKLLQSIQSHHLLLICNRWCPIKRYSETRL